MVDKQAQIALMEQVESLFNLDETDQVDEIERNLADLGFVQKGADPAVIAMEHADCELLIEIEIDEEGTLHGYELLPFGERTKKQEKFRW